MILFLFTNAAIITAYVFFIFQISLKYKGKIKSANIDKILQGLITGLLGIILMVYSFRATEVIRADLRHIAVVVSAVYGGPLPSLVTGIVIGLFRVALFGVNKASILGAIVAVITGASCAYFTHAIKSNRKKHIIMNFFAVAYISIALKCLISDVEVLMKAYEYYWTLSLFGGIISYYASEYMKNSNSSFNELKYYEAMANNMTDLISTHQLDGTFLYVSPSVKGLLGYSQGDLIGKSSLHYIHEDDVSKVSEFFKNIYYRLTDNELLAYRFKRKDNSYIWFESTAKRILDKNGKVKEIVAVSRDITLRKKAEIEAKESNNRFRAIFDHAGIGICLRDLRGNPLTANSTYFKMLGYEEDELEYIVEHIHPEDAAYDIDQYLQLIRGEKSSYRMEKRFNKKNGGVLWGDIILTLVPKIENNEPYIIGMINDITDRKLLEQEIHESQENYRIVSENASDLISIIDSQLKYVFVSPSCKHLFGYEPTEMIGFSALNQIHPDDREQILVLMQEGMEINTNIPLNISTLRYRIKNKAGAVIWVETTARAVRNEHGKLQQIVAATRDISNRVKMEEELRKSKNQVSKILESITDGFFALDKQWRFTYVNKTAMDILKRNKEDILGKVIWDEFPRILGSVAQRTYEHAMEEQVPLVIQEYYHFTKRWFEIKVFPAKDGISVYMHDITESKRSEQELERLSKIDSLTGIPNRRCFDEMLEKEWSRAMRNFTSLSLILLDIDYFKAFNDTYGHVAGDKCLMAVAEVLEKCAKRAGDMAFRYGGEEFAVILPNTNSEGAAKIAEEIRSEIESLAIEHRGSLVKSVVTSSLGTVTVVPSPSSSYEGLISMADKALYEAKNSGRNQVS